MTNFAINSSFKAVRQGQYARSSINEEHGEFILNENSDLTVATLREIAKANAIDIHTSRKSDIISEILTALSERKLPAMDQKPQSETVREIVEAGYEAGKSDDDMLIEIVQAGIKFSAAMRLFRQVQTELGLRITPKDRREYVNEILGDDFTPETAEDMQDAIDRVGKHDAIGPQQARKAVRQYLKEHEREVPKAAAQAVTVGARSKIFDFLVENPHCSEQEFSDFVREVKPGDSEKQERMVKSYTPTRLLAHRIANAAVERSDSETED